MRMAGVDAPTLKELGLDMEVGNWRGVYGASGLSPAQKKELIDAVVAATKTKYWQEQLQANAWTPSLLVGDDFAKFVDAEHQRLRAMLSHAGLL